MSAFYLPWPFAAEMVPFCAAAICAFPVMPLIVHAGSDSRASQSFADKQSCLDDVQTG